MNHYVGIEVSLEASSVCLVGGTGKIACEGKIASEPRYRSPTLTPPAAPLFAGNTPGLHEPSTPLPACIRSREFRPSEFPVGIY